MARVLITGVAGYLGRHLAGVALAAGSRVAGAVRPGGASAPWLVPAVEVHQVDVRDGEAVDRLVAATRPELVFHCAAVTVPRRVGQDPMAAAAVNLVGTGNLLEAIRSRAPAATVVIPGSSAEYGRVAPDDNPLTESSPRRPVSPYAVQKLQQAMLAEGYHRTFGLKVVRVIAFNCIGGPQSDEFVCGAFARQVAEIEAGLGPPVVRVGNLAAYRDFVDVDDVAWGCWLAGRHGQGGEVFNICSGRPVQVEEVLRILLAAAKVAIEVQLDPARLQPSDVPLQQGSYRRLADSTGWHPRTGLEESVLSTLDWWRRRVAKRTEERKVHGLAE